MDRLPVELLVNIFAWLEPQDLNNVSQVCKAWKTCCSESTWRNHFKNKFGNTEAFTRLCGKNFSWQAEVISRYKALEKWQTRKVPAISYKAPCGQVGESAVNWDFKMLFASSYTTGLYSITQLSTGAFHRRSKRAQIGADHEELPTAIMATKFGILTGYHSGAVIFTTMGEEAAVVYEHSAKIDAIWLSGDVSPSRSSKISMAVASGGEILFFSELKLVTKVVIDFSSAPDASEDATDIVRSIHPYNEEFVVLTEKSIYQITYDFLADHLIDTQAKEIRVSYPYILLCGETLTRFDMESGKTFTYLETWPSAYACDDQILVAYSEQDQMVTAWPLQERVPQPLWNIGDLDFVVTSIELNPVVVVFGGYKGTVRVANVLTGELLPVKAMRYPTRKQWELPNQNTVPSISQIHISPIDEAIMALIMDQTVMVYGLAQDAQHKKGKGPDLKRGIEVIDNEEDIELHHNYEIRRINYENMVPSSDFAQQEQLETALALSQSHEHSASEHDQLQIALENSKRENLSEEEQIRLAMELSMATSAHPADSDEELQRALDASLSEQ